VRRIFNSVVLAIALWQSSRGHGVNGVRDRVMAARFGFKAEKCMRMDWHGAQYEYYYE